MHIFIIFPIFTLFLNIGFCDDITIHENWHLLNHDTCGESSTTRIIGGNQAALGQYPWMVRLGYVQFFLPFISFKCGGALINDLYVLTAAHCLQLGEYEKLNVVRLGENYADLDYDCEMDLCAPPIQDFKPAKLISHPDYDKPTRHRNDIALIRVEKPVKFNDFVKPICLPYGPLLDENFVGKIMEVAGWGIYNMSTYSVSNKLLTVKLPVVDLKICKHSYKQDAVIGKDQICAGGVMGQDSCGGDSGGPLMAPAAVKGPPKYFVFGLVSFGDKHCGRKLPAIYTNLSKYVSWILDNIEP